MTTQIDGGDQIVAGSITLGIGGDVAGILPVANGGTGGNSLSGVLIGNGGVAFSTKTNPAGNFVGDTDVQTLTNKSISAAQINSGVLGVAVGGTGSSNAATAINSLLPSQASNALKFLQTDGTNVSWAASGGATGLTPTIQTGATYTAASGDFVVVNASTQTVTLPVAAVGRQVGVVLINPTVTSILIKTSAALQNINGIDKSTTGFSITSQYEVYIFTGISTTDWVITSTSRVTKSLVITGTQDGTNKIFTISNVPVNTTLQFYENGQLLQVTNDYTLSGAVLTYVAARNAPLATDNLTAYAVPI